MLIWVNNALEFKQFSIPFVPLPDVIKAITSSSSLLFARLIEPCCNLYLLGHPGDFSLWLFQLISALLHISEQNLISTPDEISLRPHKMAFMFPSLLETFPLIYPVYFSQSCIQPASVILWPVKTVPRLLKEPSTGNSRGHSHKWSQMPPAHSAWDMQLFSSEHHLRLNCTAHDLGPLWCLHDTPVALRFHTDSLVALQLGCPKENGNWVCQRNARPGTCFGCGWYERYWVCLNRFGWLHTGRN